MAKSNDIIQQLKANEKPFGLMSEEMQKKANEIGKGNFDYYSDPWHRCSAQMTCFHNDSTYRLRPDYEEPEPEIEEKRIYPDGKEFYFEDEGSNVPITSAPASTNFIGFNCDGWIWGRVYKNKKSGDMFIKIPANQLDDYEVCDMAQAHVLFRRPK